MILDAYSDQERSQPVLIQRFLAGGFSWSDHHPCQSRTTPACSDSYFGVMKDLHQLPLLERRYGCMRNKIREQDSMTWPLLSFGGGVKDDHISLLVNAGVLVALLSSGQPISPSIIGNSSSYLLSSAAQF